MEVEIEKFDHDSPDEDSGEFIGIPRISCRALSYDQFFKEFMLKNLPVVITELLITTRESNGWFNDGKFKLEKLTEVLQDHEVPVVNCSNGHECFKMKFSDYVGYWNGDRADGCWYLKDFHLKKEFPALDFYNVPSYFASDWLNEMLIEKGGDDYRFIYIGPKDSWTSFHCDVFGSYSWSANIHGRKKWLLLPPGDESKLKDSFGKLPSSISVDLLTQQNVKYFELIQESNETLFVPSGWHHQVHNIDDAVSINHNWFNGCNVEQIANNLIQHLDEAEREIEDCRDMENFAEHCQLMLKSSFGMDFAGLLEILAHVLDNRTRSLDSKRNLKLFDEFTLGENHIAFDLLMINNCLTRLKANEKVAKLPKLIEIIEINLNKLKQIL